MNDRLDIENNVDDLVNDKDKIMLRLRLIGWLDRDDLDQYVAENQPPDPRAQTITG